ncbi:outer membrane beta-barrel protein [Rhizorhapis sp.]|uniref:outer membrane beta-barrel protein n=1 Tax=Rhizorhapis sp. TaxID=1968842 RepID=UPI002B473182|nr:outer membrane beta-barrel protein [Rhizorhapis sp.]HKR18077.1 outer membrane beta-barrel protein [Rhizorhapis sp.]
MQKQRGIATGSLWPVLAAVAGVAGPVTPALAQLEPDNFKAEREMPEGYEPRTIRSGNLIIRPELDVTGYYDNNIYAEESGKDNDVVIHAVPRIAFDLDNQKMAWTTQGFVALRRYIDHSEENSTTFGAMSRLVARPSEQMQFGGSARFVRSAEERGDPEARTDTSVGPRIYNDYGGDLFAGFRGSRLGVHVRGEVEKRDYRSSEDNERDRTTYTGTVRGLYRVSGFINAFAQGQVRRRDYRLGIAELGIDRDSTNVSATAGLQIDPGGKLRGDIYAGAFWFNPDDNLLRKDTGVEFGAGLNYELTPRTEIEFTGFRGDVATVQPGVTGRTDTRLRLGVVQEIRHNIHFNGGVEYRDTRYRGISDIDQDRVIVDGELEYLMNRLIALAVVGRYTGRQSQVEGEDYNRWQVGLAARLKY